MRRLLHRLHNELKLPIYCLLDNDPWGYYIYSVIKQGSINLAYESQRMAIPDAKFLGLRSNDFQRVQAVRQREDHVERHRPQAGQANRQLSLVRPQEAVAEGNQTLLDNGFKLEVEALITKDISYVTEQYTPGAAEGGGLAGLSRRADGMHGMTSPAKEPPRRGGLLFQNVFGRASPRPLAGEGPGVRVVGIRTSSGTRCEGVKSRRRGESSSRRIDGVWPLNIAAWSLVGHRRSVPYLRQSACIRGSCSFDAFLGVLAVKERKNCGCNALNIEV